MPPQRERAERKRERERDHFLSASTAVFYFSEIYKK